MKKLLKIALIAGLSVMVVFLVAVLFAGIFGGRKKVFVFGFSQNVIFEKDYSENEIEDFYVRVSCGDVRFSKSDNQKIRVEIAGENKNNFSVNLENKKLEINLHRKHHVIQLFYFKPQKDVVKIYLPSSFPGDISVVQNLGNFSADDFESAKVDIQSDFGDVKLGKIRDAKVNSSIGDVQIGEVSNWIDIKSSLGDVRIGTLLLNKDSRIESALGDVRIKSVIGVYVDADVALGEKRVKDNAQNANVMLRIDSALGDVWVN